MHLAKYMGVMNMIVTSDSKLVTEQLVGNLKEKYPHLVKYLAKVCMVVEFFEDFELVYVPRHQNARADLLSKLASTKK